MIYIYYNLNLWNFLDDDTNGHQEENKNSNHDTEQMNDKEGGNENFQGGQKPNSNENSKSTKPKGETNQSRNIGNQGQDQSLASEIKSITTADVINNNNDLEKSSLKVSCSIYF